MAHPPKTRAKAFKLYSEGKGTPTISKELAVAPNTVHEWKKKYNWKERREKIREKTSKKQDINIIHEQEQMMKRQTKLGVLCQKKAESKINTIQPKELDTKEAVSLMKEGAHLERLGRGEPTDIRESKFKDGIKILWGDEDEEDK